MNDERRTFGPDLRLGSELVGGPENREIVVVEYNPTWPERYEKHRMKIAATLGSKAMRIEHVGSTAVPGLAAKPFLDIQLSVADVEAEGDYVPALENAGYFLRVREHGHRMLRVPGEVHLHVCETGSDWERKHILFRERLRNDAHDRELYGSVKRQLASREWETMNHYADAKSEVIAEIMRRAEQWARKTSWSLNA